MERIQNLEGLIEDCDTLYYFGKSNIAVLNKKGREKLELFKEECRDITETFGFNEFGTLTIGKHAEGIYQIEDYVIPKTFEFFSEYNVPDKKIYTKNPPDVLIEKITVKYNHDFLKGVIKNAHNRGLWILGTIHSHPVNHNNSEVPSYEDMNTTLDLSDIQKGGLCQLYLPENDKEVMYHIKRMAFENTERIINFYRKDRSYNEVIQMIFPKLYVSKEPKEIKAIISGPY